MPPVSVVLEDFFRDYKHVATPLERRRIALVRADLTAHLDDEGWRVLDDAQAVLLNSEQELRPTGAFTRIARSPELFSALAHYVLPTHAMIGIDQRSVQLDVIDALARKLWREHLITRETACSHCKAELASELVRGKESVREGREREQILER